MQLNKSIWTQKDGKEFQEFLKSFARPEKIEWTTAIINTKLPVLAILSPDLKKIIKQIASGNYLSFLELELNEFYENMVINGFLINSIKDFDTMQNYLIPYAEKTDSWATCDLLTFKNINKDNEKNYWELSIQLFNNKKPFIKRVGVNIWFKFIQNDIYLLKIFEKINKLTEKTDYYVQMVVAWFLAECFIKQKEKTLMFYENNNLCRFIINKSISKCRDSYRVSTEDKQRLLKYKK